jgi:transcriptional regulator with XRE-family HTH domain
MTALTPTPYVAAEIVWDFLPPVAPYDPIAPTSVICDRPPDQLVRRIELTSSFIDAATRLAVTAAVGWLAAVSGSPMDGLSATVAAGMLSWQPRTDAPRETVANEIRELRDEIQRGGGLSRSEIAQLVGVDRRSLSGWASGETSPSAANIDRLRTLARVVRRLNLRDVPELAVSMRDAEIAGVVTGAVRAGDTDRAVDAVLHPVVDEAPDTPVPALTREQWAALLRLAIAAETAEIEPDQAADDQPELPPHPLRVQLERSAYATPRRPRREMRGE